MQTRLKPPEGKLAVLTPGSARWRPRSSPASSWCAAGSRSPSARSRSWAPPGSASAPRAARSPIRDLVPLARSTTWSSAPGTSSTRTPPRWPRAPACSRDEHQAQVAPFLRAIKPQPGVHNPEARAPHRRPTTSTTAKTHRETHRGAAPGHPRLQEGPRRQARGDDLHGLDRDLHGRPRRSPSRSRRFEKALDANDPTSTPTMLYALRGASCEGVPFANGTPNLSRRHARAPGARARARPCPIAGKDLKSGQTLMKTVIAPALKARMLGLNGWFSHQHPRQPRRRGARRPAGLPLQGGHQDRACSTPSCSRTSTRSSTGSSPTRCPSTTTRRAATRRRAGTTSTSSGGSATRCRSRSNFLCRDSILAAPLVLDLALFLDLAAARRVARHPGVALVLLQEPDGQGQGSTRSTTCSSSTPS